MKIAITATGNSLDSMVDPRFGRASWFLIVETDSNTLIEAIDNTAGKEAAHGAGISAAAQVADKGVKALLTGRVGPKALPILEKAAVTPVNNVSGTILDALAEYSSQSNTASASSEKSSQFSGSTSGHLAGPGQGCNRDKGRAMGQGQGRGQGRGRCRR